MSLNDLKQDVSGTFFLEKKKKKMNERYITMECKPGMLTFSLGT